MKKLVLLFTVVVISHSGTFSQGCLPNGITFTTQQQIDNFQTNYPGCKVIQGDVTIEGSDISNLAGLNGLIALENDLHINQDSALSSLSGLNNLISIGGGLSLYENMLLTDFTGLNNLISVKDYLVIRENSALTSLKGLENLTSVGQNIWIEYNSSLKNLTALKNITTIGKELWILNNKLLESLSGLDNVASIGGGLTIDGNEVLANLMGLAKLTSIEWDLQIIRNDVLSNLTGLNKVTSVGGNLMISNNPGLTSLTGLTQLTSIDGFILLDYNSSLKDIKGLSNINATSISDLFINHNNSLSTCEVESVCNYLANPGGIVEITDNAPGCNSVEEVKAACKAVGVWSVGNWQPEVGSFPNPFSDIINIEYTLERYATVNLTIFNLYGQEIEILINEPQPGGTHLVQWNAGGLPEGIYFYRLQADNQVSTGKIIKIQKP
jgi:hypothetical protein